MKTLFSSVIALLLCGLSVPTIKSSQPTQKALVAIAIGLNSVNPNQYQGWEGTLKACENDADDMLNIARSQSYEVLSLKTKDATKKRVRDAISDAAARLKSGDTLVLSYSGHGGQVTDTNGDEEDGLDETWVLFDGEMVDDELASLWAKFQPGVRIAVYSDSCHSGTVIKNFEKNQPASTKRFRIIPTAIAEKLRALPEHQDLDKELPSERKSRAKTKASVLLISGCQDDQLSLDGDKNGAFTGELIKVWDNAGFRGSYREFQRAIRSVMPSDQKPNFDITGARNTAFEAERPWAR